MAEVRITVKMNGPLLVEGPIEIVGPDGQPIAYDGTKKAIAFCRCGQSARKPFCDGNHNRCGWNQEMAYVPPVAPGPT